MRKGEILGLTWDKGDFPNRIHGSDTVDPASVTGKADGDAVTPGLIVPFEKCLFVGTWLSIGHFINFNQSLLSAAILFRDDINKELLKILQLFSSLSDIDR